MPRSAHEQCAELALAPGRRDDGRERTSRPRYRGAKRRTPRALSCEGQPLWQPPAPPAKPAVVIAEQDEIELLATRLAAADTAVVTPAASPSATSQRGVFLQLGAFSNAENAESLRSHLSRELDWLNEAIQINAGGGIQRVQLGPYASRADAEKVAERIRLALGYKPAFVTR